MSCRLVESLVVYEDAVQREGSSGAAAGNPSDEHPEQFVQIERMQIGWVSSVRRGRIGKIRIGLLLRGHVLCQHLLRGNWFFGRSFGDDL